MMKSCPYCGQGALYLMRFRSIQMNSYICDECDTIWRRLEDVNDKYGTGAIYILCWLGTEDYNKEIELVKQIEWPV